MSNYIVSLDLETLSSNSDAAIISIGLVAIDKQSGENRYKFYENIAPHFYLGQKTVYSVCQSTLEWWEGQRPHVKNESFSGTLSLRTVLSNLQAYIKTFKLEDSIVVGNGSDFDIAILKNAFHQEGIPWPFKFWKHRCLRTALDLAGIDKHLKEKCIRAYKKKVDYALENHIAVDDAEIQGHLYFQAQRLIRV